MRAKLRRQILKYVDDNNRMKGVANGVQVFKMGESRYLVRTNGMDGIRKTFRSKSQALQHANSIINQEEFGRILYRENLSKEELRIVSEAG